MNLKSLAIALVMGISSVSPLAAQEQPKPTRPLSDSDRKRIDDLDKLIKQTQLDLDFVKENNKKQPDYDQQVANLDRKITNLKGQLAFYKRETLDDLPRSKPNSGASSSGANNPTSDASTRSVADTVWLLTGRQLTKEQSDLYLKKKAEILAWYNDPKVAPGYAKTFRWQLDIDKDKPLTLENVPDDKFVKFLYEGYDKYYRNAFHNTLETVGHFWYYGKKIEAPGLRLWKTPKGEILFPYCKNYWHPEDDPRGSSYQPELWPILFDNPNQTDK